MAKTWIPMATYTSLAGQGNISFLNIPQTWRDLVVVIQARSVGTATDYVSVSLNGDAGANYSRLQMYGDGTTAAGASTSSNIVQGTIPISTSASSDVSIMQMQFFDYVATDRHKLWLTRNSRATTEAFAQVSRWANTSAITSITFTTYTGSAFAAGSTFALYGIAG